MTDTPAHTPLPWGVEEGHIQRGSNGIRYWQITDGQDAIACNQFCYAGNHPAMNAANAAFIVRACNSHYQLVEAAKAIMPRNLNLADWLPDDATIPLDVPVSELRALAAALSQAGGAGE